MSGFFALVRKQLVESRWLLGLSAVALFALSWLFVYATYRIEREIRKSDDPFIQMRMRGLARMGGDSMDGSSTSFEVGMWRHPFIVIIVCLWPISRASLAVAGEIERGTLDMVLSRPVTRRSYLSSQVAVALIGLVVLGAALVVGNQVGNRFNPIEAPPGVRAIARPALNAMALGLAIFGYTLPLSAVDLVRWRPNLAASALTIAAVVIQVIVGMPSMEDWKWLETYSVFHYFDPVEAAIVAKQVWTNAAVLGGVGLVGIVLSYLGFGWRDLPTSG